MEGFMGENLVYNPVPSTNYDVNRESGRESHKEIYRKLLLVMVVNRNYPLAYCHVSKMFQGMSLQEIMIKQKITMVSYCMMHGTSDTLTGEEMRALAEQVHMEIGMGTPFIQPPFKKFGMWTTKLLLKTMWKNQGGLEIELLWNDILSLFLNR